MLPIDWEKGQQLYAKMSADLAAIEGGTDPAALMGWAPTDVHEMLAAFGFRDEYCPGPARICFHPKHTDLDLVVPWADPVQYAGVVKPAVKLVETLLKREGLPSGPMKESDDETTA